MFYSKTLKKFPDINHCFFSRKGGHSKGIYKGLNCGRGSNDKRINVLKNLKIISKKMRVENKKLVLMHQTHSNKVIEIKKNNYKKKLCCDAIITRLKGIALGVVTADCVPILLYDKKNKIIGGIHAGWKGAFSGIIKNTILKMNKLSSNSQIYASVGPCICKLSYEVDYDFYKKFIRISNKNNKYFHKKNKTKKIFNLRKFVSDKLENLNVKVDHVNHDTYKDKMNFYSYRRSRKMKQSDYGRCISAISLI